MKFRSIGKIEAPAKKETGCCPPTAKGGDNSSCCGEAPKLILTSKSPCCSSDEEIPEPQTSCCAPTRKAAEKAPCCGPPATATGGVIDENVPGYLGWMDTPAGRVPQIAARLTLTDHLGACKARWALNRMNFIVPPGLYAIGVPKPDDPVVVTCNYKMTYDIVRRALTGRNVWLLVLETFGVNVWCAAGKGSFGTDELVTRIQVTGLAKVLSHRRLLLPILGGPGVSAHEVARQSGFAVTYAAIRADDLQEFLDNGMVTSQKMRAITFSFYERLVLVPVEFLIALRSTLAVAVILFILGLLYGGNAAGIRASGAYLGAMLTGVAAGPLLLPWLPGRSFAVKGAVAGVFWSLLWYKFAGGAGWSIAEMVAAFLSLPAVSAFHTLNFTGCSTFTSRTGVKKEMRLSLPVMGGAVAVSAVLLLLTRFLP